jgi:hypothetical protein
MSALKKETTAAWIAAAAVNYARLDAIHAAKHSPMPMSRVSASAATSRKQSTGPRPLSFWNFSLTGPQAKLTDTPKPKQP